MKPAANRKETTPEGVPVGIPGWIEREKDEKEVQKGLNRKKKKGD